MTVLDVGCAYGALCFEAENRGATEVLGVDLNERRLKGAEALKDVLNSKVTFEARDLLENPPMVKFDYVLLLNVIHHLNDPLAMIRLLSTCARRQLIIEYPNFSDPRFPSDLSDRMKRQLNKAAVIGVSSRRVDQTFIFTDAAIEAILRDHDSLVKSIAFRPSLIPGRRVAVCTL